MPTMEIRCECGHVVRGEEEATLLSNARRHIAEHHPDLTGRLSDEDLRGMTREASASG
jgi:hypothetical protein